MENNLEIWAAPEIIVVNLDQTSGGGGADGETEGGTFGS